MDKKTKLLKQYFEEEPDIVLGFLFGSFAKGRETKDSDIDIAIYLKNKRKENAVWSKIQRILNREVDLVLLNDAPATLVSNIFKTGIPLTIKNNDLYWKFYLTKSLEAEDFSNFALDYWEISKRAMSLSSEDKTRFLERLDFLKREMQEMPEMSKITFEEYEENKLKRRNLERWTENIINALIDVSKIILASEKKEMPKTYGGALMKFGVFAGLSESDAEKLSTFARLRNLLAHEYLDILYDKIGEFVGEFPKIYGKISKFMEKYPE